ncbi:MAG: ArsA family ATPase [Deltaproteobacteria bacterium]|nr:ArsA family ATPase [Deltaproteobacteria bacterium]MBI2500702.1 ArsA family ATPase [Deltaproteobacteria bacterium]MBI4196198.1 ArsA family ATPase [Deltaproteobacteria bacterium]
MKMDEILESKKILVCCGSGGVGKTTTAAAIALEAARRGKKAIVLTIDPAKRLATALGLEQISDEPFEVELPPSFPGTLSAMMLHTKRTFDHLIEKYAPSHEVAQRILENRLYTHMSNMIAGSQEYMAMERLYELYEEGRYDLLVLDTPPTRHALDFLEAPRKMIDLTGNSLIKWMLKPGLFATRLGLRALRGGGKKILSVFDRLAGVSFLQELAEMISLLGDLIGGFHERAEAVYAVLKDPVTSFFLITTPSTVAIQDSLYFFEKIEEGGLPFSGFIINRLLPEEEPVSAKRSKNLHPKLKEKIHQLWEQYEKLYERDQKAVQLLKKMGPSSALYTKIPLFEEDVHSLEGLQKIGHTLRH